jgi:hypothetical protein
MEFNFLHSITIAADEFNPNIFFNCTINILSSLKIPQLRYPQLEQLSRCQILPGISVRSLHAFVPPHEPHPLGYAA